MGPVFCDTGYEASTSLFEENSIEQLSSRIQNIQKSLACSTSAVQCHDFDGAALPMLKSASYGCQRDISAIVRLDIEIFQATTARPC